MFKLEIKITLILVFACVLSACKENKSEATKRKRDLYQTFSIKQVGRQEYWTVWNTAKDSVQNYIDNGLIRFNSYINRAWYLDSLISFNKRADRCVMALSLQAPPYSPRDRMEYFYGAKINGKWYFFLGGGQFILPRDYYQKDVRVPLSIEQFNEIAVGNIFSGYLKKDKNGTWRINDRFFTAHFEDVGWGDFERYQDTVVHGKRFNNKKEYFESIYLDVVKGNWIKK